MPANDGHLAVLVEQNGAPRLLQKIAITSTAAVTAIAATTIDAIPKTRLTGSMVMIQSDVAFRFALTNTTTAVTNLAGTKPGTYVAALECWYFYLREEDTRLDLVAESTSGTVCVYLVTA